LVTLLGLLLIFGVAAQVLQRSDGSEIALPLGNTCAYTADNGTVFGMIREEDGVTHE
jgi:hypothetical protein